MRGTPELFPPPKHSSGTEENHVQNRNHTEHPELAALIAAFNEAREAHAAAFHPGDDYFNTQARRNADPSSWTNRIEHAFDTR